VMDAFGRRTAFGKRYISYWGYIRLNVDIPDNNTGNIILKKGEFTLAIIAEDPDGNLKAKVLNPFDLFGSSFVMLSKAAAQSDGDGHFDHMDDVPVAASYEMAKQTHDELVEMDKWQSGEYDEFMLCENDGLLH
jgi:hypothetical protein